MSEQKVVAIGYVVKDDKGTPVLGTPLTVTQQEERDDLAKSIMVTHSSSIKHHEKMTERLWEEKASLKLEKAVLEAKLKAQKNEFNQRLEEKDGQIAELRALQNKADLQCSFTKQVIGEVHTSLGQRANLSTASKRINELEAELTWSKCVNKFINEKLQGTIAEQKMIEDQLEDMTDSKE